MVFASLNYLVRKCTFHAQCAVNRNEYWLLAILNQIFAKK